MWRGVSMNSFYYVNAQYRPSYRDNPCSSMVYRWRRQLVFCCECELAGFFPADETDLHSTLTTIAIRDDSKAWNKRKESQYENCSFPGNCRLFFTPSFFKKSFSLPKPQYQYLFLYVLYSYKVNCLQQEENVEFFSAFWMFFLVGLCVVCNDAYRVAED